MSDGLRNAAAACMAMLELLTTSRDAAIVALAGVRIARGEVPAKPEPRKREPRQPLTDEQRAARKAARTRTRKPKPPSDAPRKRERKSDAAEREAVILECLRAYPEPLATRDLSRWLGIGDDRVSVALAALGKRGEAVSVGSASWRKWTAPRA